MHGVLRRLTDLAGALSLATDLAHGAPPEHQLRVAVLCSRVAAELGLTDDDRRDAFDAGLLRWLGCTAVAQPLAQLMGDEIASHRRGARFDGPLDPLLEILRNAGAGLPIPQRVAVLAGALRTGPGVLFGSTCEAAADLAGRLGYSADVVGALSVTFERYDGKGWPGKLSGDAIPIAARIAMAAEDIVTIAEFAGPETAEEELSKRAGRQHDPAVVTALRRVHRAAYGDFDSGDAWELLSAADPRPDRYVGDNEIEERLLVVADMVDLKVPTMAGHSRAVAALSAGAAQVLGGDQVEAGHAGLLHDIGRVSVSNDVWTRSGPLSSADRERIRLAPYHTERIWSRSAWLAPIGALASQHAERLDGSGYHRGLAGSALSPAARVLQAAKRYRSLVEERPHRPAYAPPRAAELLREGAAAGKFDARVVEAVIAAAGGRTKARRAHPDGLTSREVEVLALVAQGLPNKEIAARLVIAHRTVGHHVAHIYDKIGVTTRAGAALYAMRKQLIET
jgi:HD-GYP domain-containing protein (c-di-GMP phosphodiesterase class II)